VGSTGGSGANGPPGATGSQGVNGPTGNIFSQTGPIRGTVISDTDTHIYYLVDNSGGSQNTPPGSGTSSGNPQLFTLPHATTPGRVVVLVATCRTVGSGNVCNNPSDGSAQPINGAQISATVQSGDTIITNGTDQTTSSQATSGLFVVALITDGNHHWFMFNIAN
jgi:hypothetical protein